jgi:hypothetical protein
MKMTKEELIAKLVEWMTDEEPEHPVPAKRPNVGTSRRLTDGGVADA